LTEKNVVCILRSASMSSFPIYAFTIFTIASSRALAQIVRVLKPGGMAILSHYKRTGEYAEHLRRSGFTVERRWGNPLYTFPPLGVVVARKPRTLTADVEPTRHWCSEGSGTLASPRLQTKAPNHAIAATDCLVCIC
jgi:hypothetical protein